MEFTTVTDSLEKPEVDERDYRIIRLANELEVLLVHDAETDKASAALDVHVGHLSDPREVAGLAHFCEHLLFMGTEKYPAENDYNEYLSSHNGSSNAFTGLVDTNYFFEVNHAYLEEALDRFSQFFIAPLFLEDCKDREMLAVDSENKKNLQNDMWRSYQLEKSLCNPEHVYSKFGTGNLETLRDIPVLHKLVLRDELLKFHSEHYSANQMKLVILGRQSLDDLEKLALAKFGSVANKGLPQVSFEGQVLRKEQELGYYYTFKPIKDMRSIEICFPTPDCDRMWKSQPGRYLAHLIGHEGIGSLLSVLKKRGWVLYLGAGASNVCPGTDFFKISMELTESGLENWQSIVELTFVYINILKLHGVQKWIWDELRLIGEADFRFKEATPASRFTSSAAGKLQRDFDKRYLLGSSVPREFISSEIQSVLDALRTDNFRVALADPNVKTDRVEQWYSTEFRVDKLPGALLARLAQLPSSDELSLPARNEFIPERFYIGRKDIEKKITRPTLINHTQLCRVWWKKDDTFWVPRANLLALIRNPIVHVSADAVVMTRLFVELLKDALNEYTYNAEIAGLQYTLEPHADGINLGFSGYSDKMHVLIEKVLLKMKDFQVSEERFLIEKERLVRKFRNFYYEAPTSQVSYYTTFAIAKDSFPNEAKQAALEALNLTKLQSFIDELFKAVHIEILAHGNMAREDALTNAMFFEDILRPKALSDSEIQPQKSLWIPYGSHCFSRQLVDPANTNSSIEYFCEIGYANDMHKRAMASLLAQIANEPAFNQLRTKEQLGYIVFSGIRTTLSATGFRIIIQSEKSAAFLEVRIDAFLDTLKAILENMSDDEYHSQRDSLINKKNERLKNLAEETRRYWSHIISGYYNFHEIDIQTEHIQAIKKDNLIEFFMEYIHPSSSKRRKLATYLTSQKVLPDAEGMIMGLTSYLTAKSLPSIPDGNLADMVTTHSTNANALALAMRTYLAQTSGVVEDQIGNNNFTDDLEQLITQLATNRVSEPVGTITDLAAFKKGLDVMDSAHPVSSWESFYDTKSAKL